MNPKLQLWTLFYLLLVLSAAGRAESQLFDLSLDDLLEVRVTGATLKPESLREVPSAVTVFQGEELGRMAVDSIGELFDFAPGFQSYRSSDFSNQWSFSSRGRRIGNVGSDILVLVDGMRMDVPRTSGAVNTISQYPLAAIERVEFIRGPGSAVFGSNAMLGVVNIVTRSGESGFDLEAGSFGGVEMRGRASFDQGPLSIDVFAQWKDDDGDDFTLLVPNSGGRVETRDPRRSARLDIKGSWRDTRFFLKHGSSKTWGFLNNGFSDNSEQRTALSFDQVGVEQAFSVGDVDFSLLGSVSEEDTFGLAIFAPEGALARLSVPPSSEPMRAVTDNRGNREYRLRLVGDWVASSRSELQFGFEFRYLDVNDLYVGSNYDFRAVLEGRFPVDFFGGIREGITFQGASTRSILGVFGQYRRELADGLALTAGLRHDDFSGLDSQLSPRLGLTYELDGNNSVKLLYGKAFRAPAESELNFADNPFFVGNQELAAETVETLDLLWVGIWNDLYVSLGGFVSSFEDSISILSFPGGLNRFENVKLSEVAGFEFELSREVGERWLGRATFTRIASKPELSFREAAEKGTLSLNYQGERWNAYLGAVWTAGRSSQNIDGSLINLDDFWRLNAKLSFDLRERLSLYLSGKNLSDEQFLVPSLSADYLSGIPSRGRELRAGLAFRF